jgi:hypothetical protein
MTAPAAPERFFFRFPPASGKYRHSSGQFPPSGGKKQALRRIFAAGVDEAGQVRYP